MRSAFLLGGINCMTMLTHYIRGALAINDLSTIYIDSIKNVTHSLFGRSTIICGGIFNSASIRMCKKST